MKKKTVLVFGTFDFLHSGHLFFLAQAKKKGDRLVVVIARDSVVRDLKDHAPVHTEKERKKLVENLRCVDQVCLGDKKIGKYMTLTRIHPDLVAIGHSQTRLGEHLTAFVRKNKLPIRIVHLREYKEKGERSSTVARALYMI